MKLLIGLGNPGKKYEKNRHNVGFMFIDYLIKKEKVIRKNNKVKFRAEITEIEIHEKKMLLVKPQDFMNNSGRVVQHVIQYLKPNIQDLVVVHDDLDLKLGDFKIQKGKGPKLHNGIESIEKALGNKDFWRVRIGVDNRLAYLRIPGETYVLQNFLPDELQTLISTTFPQLTEELKKQLT